MLSNTPNLYSTCDEDSKFDPVSSSGIDQDDEKSTPTPMEELLERRCCVRGSTCNKCMYVGTHTCTYVRACALIFRTVYISLFLLFSIEDIS